MPVKDREAAEAGKQGGEMAREIVPLEDVMNYMRRYARENPETFALWCLGIGFVLGWRLKPW